MLHEDATHQSRGTDCSVSSAIVIEIHFTLDHIVWVSSTPALLDAYSCVWFLFYVHRVQSRVS